MKKESELVRCDSMIKEECYYPQYSIDLGFSDAIECDIIMSYETHLTKDNLVVNMTFSSILHEPSLIQEFTIPYTLKYSIEKSENYDVTEIIYGALKETIDDAYIKLLPQVEQYYKCKLLFNQDICLTDFNRTMVRCDTLEKKSSEVVNLRGGIPCGQESCQLHIFAHVIDEGDKVKVCLGYEVFFKDDDGIRARCNLPYEVCYSKEKYKKYGKSELIYGALKETYQEAYKFYQPFIESYFIDLLPVKKGYFEDVNT